MRAAHVIASEGTFDWLKVISMRIAHLCSAGRHFPAPLGGTSECRPRQNFQFQLFVSFLIRKKYVFMLQHTNNPLFHTDPTRVRGYEIDLAQQASLPSMIRMMHEAAMQHVLALKISAKELGPMNLGWVLHQQKIEIIRRPSLGEHLKILTHPAGKAGVMTYRDFHFYDEKEQEIAFASTAWLLFHTEKRRIVRFPPFIDEWLEKANALDHLPRPERELPPLDHADFRMLQTVRYNELDFNAHLSNYYYARWAMDCLPPEWLEAKQVQSLNMKFQEECHLGDEVEVLAQQVGEDKLIHSLRKGDKELVRAVSVWN